LCTFDSGSAYRSLGPLGQPNFFNHYLIYGFGGMPTTMRNSVVLPAHWANQSDFFTWIQRKRRIHEECCLPYCLLMIAVQEPDFHSFVYEGIFFPISFFSVT